MEVYEDGGFTGIKKYLANYVDKSGNQLGADLIFGSSGDLVDVSNETRQKELWVCPA